MEPADFAPTQRHHLGRGIEFHRARAKWNHAPVQGDVLAFETTDVAQKFGLSMIAVEDGLL